jgi:hypothetical protein
MMMYRLMDRKLIFFFFSLVQLPPPFPVSKYSVQYTDRVWLGGGGGCPVKDHILQEFKQHSVSDQILKLQNRYTTPKQSKNLGEGPQIDEFLPQSPFTDQFFR